MIGAIHNQNHLSRWQGSQRRIGITGGIASGKSSVGRFLKEVKGIPILDADVFAREALSPGQKSTQAVLERFGDQVRSQNQNEQPSINRSALSKIIFADPKERFWIEQLLHPIVSKRLQDELLTSKNVSVIALIIPLLFEAGLTELCSEIWVVHCTTKQQCERLMKRDHITAEEAQKRIQAQWPLKKKLSLADLVIDNSGISQEWLKKVDEVC